VGDHTEPVPLTSGRVTAAGLRESIEASLKRQAPGFLRTMGVVAPAPTLPPQVAMQYRMQGRTPPKPPPEFDQLESRLRQDYNVRDVSLDGAGGVPGDVDVLLVLKPRALSDRAVYNLDQYLMRGGRVIVCAGSFEPAFGPQGLAVRPVDTGLEAWLKHDGIEVSKTLLLDDRNQPLPVPEVRQTIFGAIQTWALKPYPYLVEVGDKGMKDPAITSKLDAVGIYWGSPIEVLPGTEKKVKVTPILASSDRSWTDDDPSHVGRVQYTVPDGTKPHLVAVALQGRFDSFFAGKPVPPAPGDSTHQEVPIARSPETRLVVVGNSEFVSDLVGGALGRQANENYLQNLGFIQNLVDWMNLDNDLVAIRSRSSAPRPLHRMSRTAEMSLEGANYVIPAAFLLLLGLSRFWRRRRVRPILAAAPKSAALPKPSAGVGEA
jgi:ABC-2 type transport system permease protein